MLENGLHLGLCRSHLCLARVLRLGCEVSPRTEVILFLITLAERCQAYMQVSDGFTWNCYDRIVRLKPVIGSSIANTSDDWSFFVQQQLTELEAVLKRSQGPVLSFQGALKSTA